MSEAVKQTIGENHFKVEKILKSRIGRKGRIEYFIKWVDFPPEENTWEPLDHLLEGCHHMIREFENIGSHDTNGATLEDTTHSMSSSVTPSHDTPLPDTRTLTTATDDVEVISLTDGSESMHSADEDSDDTIRLDDNHTTEEPSGGRPQKGYSGFPKHLIPQRIVNAAFDGKDIWFWMEWSNSADVSVVLAKEANLLCPQLVIQFYEKRAFFR